MNGRVLTSPLLANFVASDISGPSPMMARFINTSYGDYDHTLWDFGDGATSTLENPAHTYTRPGVYTVTLTVNGAGGRDTFAKAGYITVQPDDSRLVEQDRTPLSEQSVRFA